MLKSKNIQKKMLLSILIILTIFNFFIISITYASDYGEVPNAKEGTYEWALYIQSNWSVFTQSSYSWYYDQTKLKPGTGNYAYVLKSTKQENGKDVYSSSEALVDKYKKSNIDAIVEAGNKEKQSSNSKNEGSSSSSSNNNENKNSSGEVTYTDYEKTFIDKSPADLTNEEAYYIYTNWVKVKGTYAGEQDAYYKVAPKSQQEKISTKQKTFSADLIKEKASKKAANNVGVETEDEESSGDGLSEAVDGVVGLLLYPMKFLILMLGKAVEIVLGFFSGNGASLTVQDILFNNVEITDINFFDFNVKDKTIKTIRQNVAAWYIGVRNLATVALVIILIYVGIRMAISTVAEDKAKYKEMLINWFTSMCLLYALHFIILLTIQLNNTLVSTIGHANGSGNLGDSFFHNGLFSIKATYGFANAICYLLLQFLTFAFLISYIKRMITLAFLIIIAPLVTITYSIDKMGDGKSQALNMWFKEFAFNILIQPFQCIAYLALCSTALNLAENADLKSGTIAICLLAFLAKSAEEIVKQIFGIKADSMSSPAASAALGYTLAKTGNEFISKARGKSSEKAPDIPKTEEKTNTQTSRTAQNNIQNGSQESAQMAVQTTSALTGATSGSGIFDKNGNQLSSTGNTRYANPNPIIYGANNRPISSSQNRVNSNSSARNAQKTQTQAPVKRSIKGYSKVRGFATGLLNVNMAGFGALTGLAAGIATGETNNIINGTILGLGAGSSVGSNWSDKINASHFKANSARAFNNYKATHNSMSDEEISERGMKLLKGDIDPENNDDVELKNALADYTNYNRRNGASEKDSIEKTDKLLKDIREGKQGEETGISRFEGNIQKQYYTIQQDRYNKKLTNHEYKDEEEKKKFEEKRDNASKYLKDREIREKLANRNNNKNK